MNAVSWTSRLESHLMKSGLMVWMIFTGGRGIPRGCAIILHFLPNSTTQSTLHTSTSHPVHRDGPSLTVLQALSAR